MGTWKSEKLGRLCSISIGGTPARANPLYWDTAKTGRNLWASIKDLKNHFIEIDYLIVHELAHLLQPNHTAKFWNIVSVQVPRYEKAKDWLKEHGDLLEVDF